MCKKRLQAFITERGIIAQTSYYNSSNEKLIAIKLNVPPADSRSIESELIFLNLFEREGFF